MRLSDFVYELTTYTFMVLWGGAKNKIALLLTFWRLFFKRIIAKCFGIVLRKEKIFDYTIKFYNYDTFLNLFEEIFLVRPYFVKVEKNNPFIIDCGSNIGMSVLFFKWLYPDSKIIAFEANPSAYQFLKQNIDNNKLKNVTAINQAVCEKGSTISFYVDPTEQDSAVSGITPQVLVELGCKMKEIKIEAVQLSKYILDTVDILKLDVEASEGIILEEIYNKLDLVKTLILDFNYSPRFINERNKLSKILEMLDKKGFKYAVTGSIRKELLWNSRSKPFDLIIYAYKNGNI